MIKLQLADGTRLVRLSKIDSARYHYFVTVDGKRLCAINEALPLLVDGWRDVLWLDPSRAMLVGLGSGARVSVPVRVAIDDMRASYVGEELTILDELLHMWRSIGGPVEVRGVSKLALTQLSHIAKFEPAQAPADGEEREERVITLDPEEAHRFAERLAAPPAPSPRLVQLMAEKEQRCPHDGGYCHHNCEAKCWRKDNCGAFETPWQGFPVAGDAPVPIKKEGK